ncbi:TorD/DmsD family molecular chaperone [Natranaeroarchaeum aerophilus]|uniref:Molecular chaperone TorD family protein n=1 Tax=Natranaeroarchaeum aerophilus TaxID=2917711 RepID=A0AAE3K5B6_9EURY|nr:molecular chaperone TorD family protein [Natranaeroarchaeum aerophilus]MCL9813295.1 molecular chaperone TorD family protein [Natranaeroarchaeum aerophilus]
MSTRHAELYAALASCFQHPDEDFLAAIRDGTLETTFGTGPTALSTVEAVPPVEDLATLRHEYLRTFEAFEGEYAPPAESAYEQWWDGTERGILSGPPASDMKGRYEALEAEVPPEYPADHISLLLEYASLLLDAEQYQEYARFHGAHFDWIPAFRERVEETSDSAFYLWAVRTLDAVVDAVGERYVD